MCLSYYRALLLLSLLLLGFGCITRAEPSILPVNDSILISTLLLFYFFFAPLWVPEDLLLTSPVTKNSPYLLATQRKYSRSFKRV